MDEWVGEGSLTTHKSVKHGLAFRRLRHLSGFLISAGRTSLKAY